MDNSLFTLMLGSVSAIALTYLIVEGLKRFGAIGEDSFVTAPRAALLVAAALTGVVLAGEFVDGAQRYIDTAAPVVFGGLVAGLFYDIAGDLLLERARAAVAAFLGSK